MAGVEFFQSVPGQLRDGLGITARFVLIRGRGHEIVLDTTSVDLMAVALSHEIRDRNVTVVPVRLTNTPFISLNTTPLMTIGDFGSSVFSCSKRQPSCLQRREVLTVSRHSVERCLHEIELVEFWMQDRIEINRHEIEVILLILRREGVHRPVAG